MTTEPREAERLGLLLQTILDQGTVAVVGVAIGILPSRGVGGESPEDYGTLHLDL